MDQSNVSKNRPMWQLHRDLGYIVPARWMDLPSDLTPDCPTGQLVPGHGQYCVSTYCVY